SRSRHRVRSPRPRRARRHRGRSERCSYGGALRRQAQHETYGVADAADLLQLAIGDLDVEAVLEGRDELDEVERVDVHVTPIAVHRGLLGVRDLDASHLLTDRDQHLLFGVLACGHRVVSLPSVVVLLAWREAHAVSAPSTATVAPLM